MFAAKNYPIFALESYSVHSCEYWGHLANFPIPSSKQKKKILKKFSKKKVSLYSKKMFLYFGMYADQV